MSHSPFTMEGASPERPSRYSAILTGRFVTGLWTQRSPLRDGATPLYYEKYGMGRYESLIDGENVELTNRLTIARRPGLSVYNSQTFPPINSFYTFHTFGDASQIRVIADTDSYVYDATGPNTKITVFSKASGSEQTHFQSVGNTLYFGNGLEEKKWVQSATIWKSSTQFDPGDLVVDPNLNLQIAVGSATLNVVGVTILNNVATLVINGQVTIPTGASVRLANFTGTSTFLNGVSAVLTGTSFNQITFNYTHADYSANDTGTVSVSSGLTGSSQPAWFSTVGAITIDGGQQWLCKGSSVQKWGIDYPTTKPTAVNSPQPSIYPNWASDTVYNTSLSVIGGSYIHRLTTGGTTGGSEPSWNTTIGGTTTDGTAVWTNVGSSAWANNHSYSVGDLVAVSVTEYVTVNVCFSPNVGVQTPNGVKRFDELPLLCEIVTAFGPRKAKLLVSYFDGEMLDMGGGELVTKGHLIKRNGVFVRAEEAFPKANPVSYKGKVFNLSVLTDKADEHNYVLANGEVAHNFSYSPPFAEPDCGTETYTVTTSSVFKCTVTGNSGSYAPAWITATGATVQDNTVTWTNVGTQQTWSSIGANTKVSTATIVIDGNGNKQQIASSGKSSASAPSWKTKSGETTSDNTLSWLCLGPYSAGGTAAWKYAYAYRNSVTGHVSTASPTSDPITLAPNSNATVQGLGSSDPQVDTIELYRTAQGGSTLLWLGVISNPGGGRTWTYYDTSSDSQLNELILAQISSSSNPPPSGLRSLSYHQGRVWGAVENLVYASGGPDTLNGSGSEAFPPANVFAFPSKVTRLQPYTQGLLVFTVSDVYVIVGQGAITNFYSVPFLKGYGLLSYNAFDTNGSVFYLMTSDDQLLTFDPSSGISDVGFPIGDKFSKWDASKAYVTWHASGSVDKAAYVADGTSGWYRLNPTPAPETGLTWSPFANFDSTLSGCRAVESVEIEPGQHRLLVSSAVNSPILMRDLSVSTDNGTTFPAFATIGSIMLAPHGQMAGVDFIGVDCPKIGSAPTIGVLLDEVSGDFESLTKFVADPPQLPPSETLWGIRYYLSQTQAPAVCRHMQIKISWPAEDAANELWAYVLYGTVFTERG